MGACSSSSRQHAAVVELDEAPTTPVPPAFPEMEEGDSDAPAARWSHRRRRRRRQQLRDEARLAEIVALQQSLAAMEDFFQSLLGQAHHYMEAMDPQQGGNTGPPPASETAIMELPKVANMRAQCGICGDSLKEGTVLPCSHVYHTECIEPWLRRHCTCPVCRYELQTEDESYEEGRVERMSLRKTMIDETKNEDVDRKEETLEPIGFPVEKEDGLARRESIDFEEGDRDLKEETPDKATDKEENQIDSIAEM